jgi:hypothetical protein
MTTTQYLTAAQYRAAKARLTRAVNSGDTRRIIDTVEAQFAAWDEGNFAFPDDWHRWERAAFDARHALLMGHLMR